MSTGFVAQTTQKTGREIVLQTETMSSSSSSADASRSSSDGIDAFASEWWQLDGAFSMLHKMQPARMRYLREQMVKHALAPQRGGLRADLRALDIGCGGGADERGAGGRRRRGRGRGHSFRL